MGLQGLQGDEHLYKYIFKFLFSEAKVNAFGIPCSCFPRKIAKKGLVKTDGPASIRSSRADIR